MNQIIYTTTITNLLIGSGQGIASVDIPIARERATNWPVVPGSSLKGVLRDKARLTEAGGKRDSERDVKSIDREIAYLYGATDDAEASAGALAFSDQRIIAFPVRSLQGTFALVTCELALRRLNELRSVAGLPPVSVSVDVKAPDGCKVPGEKSEVLDKSKVYLEDQDFSAEVVNMNSVLDLLIESGIDRGVLERHLVVVSNTTFTYLAESATELTTKVSLEFGTKTAKGGFLRTEESVPPMAIFAGVVLAHPMKQSDKERVEAHLDELNGSFIQLGAKASTGMGICRVNVVSGGAQ